MRSACDRNDGWAVSHWIFGRMRDFAKTGIDDAMVTECLLEEVRLRKNPDAVSRGCGLFFFETIANAERARERWKLESNGLAVTKVNFSASRSSTHDSEWITEDVGTDLERIEKYWNGDPLGENSLYEIIASGSGSVVDDEIREYCYSNICERYPDSSFVLAASAAAFHCGHKNVGQVIAIGRNDNGIIRADLRLDMSDFSGDSGIDFSACITQAKEEGLYFPCADVAKELIHDGKIVMPDVNWGKSFEMPATQQNSLVERVKEILDAHSAS